LAEALAREGLFVYVPRGVKVEKVVVAKLHGVVEPGMNVLRSLIWLEPGAELKLVLDLQGKSLAAADSLFHLAKTDLILEEDARLHFTDVSNLKQEVVNLRYSQARLERGAKLDWIYMATATALSKQSLQVNLEGEGAEVEVRGVYFPTEGQKISVDTVQNHLAPHTRSNLLFRGAANGNGEAIWRGMIYVDPVAQKRMVISPIGTWCWEKNPRSNPFPGLRSARMTSAAHMAPRLAESMKLSCSTCKSGAYRWLKLKG